MKMKLLPGWSRCSKWDSVGVQGDHDGLQLQDGGRHGDALLAQHRPRDQVDVGAHGRHLVERLVLEEVNVDSSLAIPKPDILSVKKCKKSKRSALDLDQAMIVVSDLPNDSLNIGVQARDAPRETALDIRDAGEFVVKLLEKVLLLLLRDLLLVLRLRLRRCVGRLRPQEQNRKLDDIALYRDGFQQHLAADRHLLVQGDVGVLPRRGRVLAQDIGEFDRRPVRVAIPVCQPNRGRMKKCRVSLTSDFYVQKSGKIVDVFLHQSIQDIVRIVIPNRIGASGSSDTSRMILLRTSRPSSRR